MKNSKKYSDLGKVVAAALLLSLSFGEASADGILKKQPKVRYRQNQQQLTPFGPQDAVQFMRQLNVQPIPATLQEVVDWMGKFDSFYPPLTQEQAVILNQEWIPTVRGLILTVDQLVQTGQVTQNQGNWLTIQLFSRFSALSLLLANTTGRMLPQVLRFDSNMFNRMVAWIEQNRRSWLEGEAWGYEHAPLGIMISYGEEEEDGNAQEVMDHNEGEQI